MDSCICFLITLLYGDKTLKVVLKIDRNELEDDTIEYPMEQENRRILHSLLPDHLQNIGPIIDVNASIFDVCVIHS